MAGRTIAIAMLGGLVLAGQALAQTPPLLKEVLPLDPKLQVQMVSVDIPPAGQGPITTIGGRGHSHPGSTYAYVVSGAVVSRLGVGPERLFHAGEAWSETPGQAHFLVNASKTEPARLMVLFVADAGVTRLTAPLAEAPAPASPPPAANATTAAPAACTAVENHQLDFWIGRWQVYRSGTERKVADSLIEGVYNGCGVRENWEPLVAGGGGGSLSGYVPAEHVWKQTWLDSTGAHVEFVGGWDGSKLAITGDWTGPTTPAGTHNYVRMMYAPNPDGSVRQWGEASPDGKTWSPSFDLTYRRVS